MILFICDYNANRIQPYIINLQTTKLLKPVVTRANPAYSKFWSNRSSEGIYFTAELVNNRLRKVKVYSDIDFQEKFPEYLI